MQPHRLHQLKSGPDHRHFHGSLIPIGNKFTAAIRAPKKFSTFYNFYNYFEVNIVAKEKQA